MIKQDLEQWLNEEAQHELYGLVGLHIKELRVRGHWTDDRQHQRDVNESLPAIARKLSEGEMRCIKPCKECKNFKAYDDDVSDYDGHCDYNDTEVDEDDFCSFGYNQ